jgi:hypothetical protein
MAHPQTHWECDIVGDCPTFTSPEDLIEHQATAHEQIMCEICQTVVPDGFLALAHVFQNHSRAEYVRAYDASAEEVRRREEVYEYLEANADIDAVASRLEDSSNSW